MEMFNIIKTFDRSVKNSSAFIDIYEAVMNNDTAKLRDYDKRKIFDFIQMEDDPTQMGLLECLSSWRASNPDIFHLGRNITEMLFYTKFGDKVSDDILQSEIIFPSISRDRLVHGVYMSFVEPLGHKFQAEGMFFSLRKYSKKTTEKAEKLFKSDASIDEDYEAWTLFGKWTLRIIFKDGAAVMFNAPYNPDQKLSDFISYMDNSRDGEICDDRSELSLRCRIIAVNALLYWQYEQSEFKKHPKLESINDKTERTKDKLGRLKSKVKKRKAQTKLRLLNEERRFYDRLYLIESQPMEVKTTDSTPKSGERKKPGRHPVRGFWRRTAKGRKFIKPHWRGEGKTLASKNWVSLYDQEIIDLGGAK